MKTIINWIKKILKRAEQEPKNLEMYMLIEHLAGQIEITFVLLVIKTLVQ